MIKKIKIENYRSLERIELELRRLNLLIGPNNSGKSNFLNALAFLGQLSRGSVEDAFGAGPRAFEQMLFRGAAIDSSIAMSVELGDIEFANGFDCAEYSVGVRRTSPESPFEITRETLRFWDSHDESDQEILFETDDRRKLRFDNQAFGSTRDTILFQYRGSSRHPEIGQVARALSRQRTYRFDPWVAGTPCDDVETRDLGHDGRNLPAVLFSLRASSKGAFEAIEESLSGHVQEFKRLTLPVIGNRSRALGMIEKYFDSPFTARELSDGVLLTIAMTTLAHLETAPSLIAIEEPEHGIHPTRLFHIVDLFREVSERGLEPGSNDEPAAAEGDEEKNAPRQVIFTSHSPYLLEKFRENPEEVFVARREEGGRTVIAPLNSDPSAEKKLRESKANLLEGAFSDILGVEA
jgi:predicted ATPase